MSKGPGLFTDIGKKAKGKIILSLFFCYPFLVVFVPVKIARLLRAFEEYVASSSPIRSVGAKDCSILILRLGDAIDF